VREKEGKMKREGVERVREKEWKMKREGVEKKCERERVEDEERGGRERGRVRGRAGERRRERVEDEERGAR
jgi:hypothetical protein